MGPTVLWPVAAAAQSEDDCYDARVSAVVVQQVPTVLPDMDDGSIVIRWPWIVDLEVTSVLEGEALIRAALGWHLGQGEERDERGERDGQRGHDDEWRAEPERPDGGDSLRRLGCGSCWPSCW